ncbi:MAG: MarR family winged helix-turn-helix transcriptional regulator [Alphaproteobacteria bacterium]
MDGEPGDKDLYLNALLLIERLHRRLLDVLKAELDRVGRGDINNVQALILYNIGDDELTVGELTYRGYYLGSNVSYNVKKLVENDYLLQARSQHDKRSVRVKLSDKGLGLRDEVNALFERHVDKLFAPGAVPADQVAAMNASLRKLERFWSSEVQFGG